MLNLTVTGIRLNEARFYGGTIYANFVVGLARPDAVPISERPQDWQIDTTRYPEIAAKLAELQPLITAAYMYEAALTDSPNQEYIPPAPEPEPEPPAEPVDEPAEGDPISD